MFPTNSERLTGISDAFSAFVYGYPSSSPRAHCTPNKSVPTLRYTRMHGLMYTGHACRPLPSAVPCISEDRLLGAIFFANLVGGIRRSFIRGPKSFTQHVLGTLTRPIRRTLPLIG